MVHVYFTELAIFEVSRIDVLATSSFLLPEELPVVHAPKTVAPISINAMIIFFTLINFNWMSFDKYELWS
jgi:hypothetical protein